MMTVMLIDNDDDEEDDDVDADDVRRDSRVRSVVDVTGCDVISVLLDADDGVIVCVDDERLDVIEVCVEVTVSRVLTDE